MEILLILIAFISGIGFFASIIMQFVYWWKLRNAAKNLSPNFGNNLQEFNRDIQNDENFQECIKLDRRKTIAKISFWVFGWIFVFMLIAIKNMSN